MSLPVPVDASVGALLPAFGSDDELVTGALVAVVAPEEDGTAVVVVVVAVGQGVVVVVVLVLVVVLELGDVVDVVVVVDVELVVVVDVDEVVDVEVVDVVEVPGQLGVVVVVVVVSVLCAAAEEGCDVDVDVGVVVEVDVVASEGCSFWIGAAHTPSVVATEHCEVLRPFETAPPAALPLSATTLTTDTDRNAAAAHGKSLKIRSLIGTTIVARSKNFYPRKVVGKSTGR